MIIGEDQRSWADICPDFLESIYSRLTSHVDGTHFGGVCKNWHQVHSQVAISNPLPVVIIPAKFSSSDVIEVREGRMFLQRRRESQIPEELAGADITILGRVGAWFLIRVHGGLRFYNPLLQKPKSCIYLPGEKSFRFSNFRRDPTPLPISFAFSGMPTARNMMILVVYGDRFFNAFSPKNQKFETYDFSLGGKKGQLCLGVGYKNGRFFCLFEMGDMLIFSVDENETRMLLGATKPLLPEQLQMCDNLSVVAVVAAKMNATTTDEVGELLGFTVVTHWERDHEASEKDIFRLVAVEENAMTTTTELLENDYEIASLEDGDNNRGVILVRDPLQLKRNVDGYYMIIMIDFLAIVVFLGAALLGISSSYG
ncbi:unnamed protein product [Linum trigynum]|uniref:DUF295 domain-containing protein n=1 Tax=Linum trigynum TaxID=586398 RepID=A0AAV2GB98_9ROSI